MSVNCDVCCVRDSSRNGWELEVEGVEGLIVRNEKKKKKKKKMVVCGWLYLMQTFLDCVFSVVGWQV
jgi:hypothetical protein